MSLRKRTSLDWDDLKYVLAVARDGSLSGAARTLGVNHATVFRRLKTIEARQGVRLFERLPSGYVCTAAGEDAAAAAARIETEVTALGRRLAGRDARLGGVVRVTTTDTLALPVLPPILAALRRTYPEIEIELDVANAVANLGRREADIALRPTTAPPESAVGRRLLDIAFAVYGAREYLDARPAQSLGEHDWVALDDDFSGLAAARWVARDVPDATVVARAGSLMAVAAMVRAGLGLAVLPCYLADAAPELERLTAPMPEIATPLWLLTHVDLRHTARIRAVLDFLASAIVADRARFAGDA